MVHRIVLLARPHLGKSIVFVQTACALVAFAHLQPQPLGGVAAPVAQGPQQRAGQALALVGEDAELNTLLPAALRESAR